MTNVGVVPSEPIDDETEGLVNGIMKELEENPPVKCPFTFNWSGNQELANRVNSRIQIQAILLRRAHPWLNFGALDSIIFHHDYAEALREISGRAGRPCKATAEPSGIGLAMVVHLEDKCVAVLDAGVALGIAEGDGTQQDLCVDMVMHELCHVHDYGRKRTLLSHEFLSRRVIGLERHVFSAAESAWSEYFANRYSNGTYSSPDLHPQYLANVVPDVVDAVREGIRAYRTHHQLDVLLPLCEQKVHFLFQCFGYAAGRLVANEMTLAEIAPESVAALKDAGLVDVWEAIVAELNRLDACRDEWASFDELKPLMQLVDLTFRRLGLLYKDADGQIYVDIPFAAETMPVGLSRLELSKMLKSNNGT